MGPEKMKKNIQLSELSILKKQGVCGGEERGATRTPKEKRRESKLASRCQEDLGSLTHNRPSVKVGT